MNIALKNFFQNGFRACPHLPRLRPRKQIGILTAFLLFLTYPSHLLAAVSESELAEYSPKPLPKELTAKIQNYLDIRAPGFALLSPDGKTMFFSWRVTGVRQIWKIENPLGFPIQMTAGEDSTNLQDITPDGRFLIVERDEGGQENPGLYLQSTKGGPLIPIQKVPERQTRYEFVTPDSKWIYFISNDQDPASYAIYKYNLKTKKRELVLSEPGTWSIADHNEKGQLLLSKRKTALTSEIYEYQESSKKLTPVVGQREDMEFKVSYSGKKGELFVLSPLKEEFRRLYRFKGDHFKAETAPLKHDVASFLINQSRSVLVFTINENGYTRLRIQNLKSGHPIEIAEFKKADHVSPLWIDPKGRFVTVLIENSNSLPQPYVLDLRTRQLVQWTKATAPEADLSQFSVSTIEAYPARDGTEIPMVVRRPNQCPRGQEKKCPVIVSFHGGPEGQSVPGFSVYAQFFLNEGFIFVEPNVRGSDGYGQTWLGLDNGPKRLNVITDIEDVAIFLRKSWGSQKIGVTGGSYGGYSTLMAMTRFSGAFDAGVASVGMSHLITFLNNTAPYRRHLRISEYGDPEKDKEALIQLSPLTYLDKIKNPLLIIQGANDPRVPVTEAIQMRQAMAKKKVIGDLILFGDEGHGPSKRSNQAIQIGHTVLFFKTHLQNLTP